MNLENKNLFNLATVKNFMRLISLILITLFFIPTFMVSCSGQDIDISAKTVAVGYNYQKQEIISSHPICIMLLIVPLAIFVIWSLKGILATKSAALITGLCALIDFIMWIALKTEIKKTALNNAFTFRTTGWYHLNWLLLLLLLLLSIGVYLNVLKSDTNLIALFSKSHENATSNSPNGYCENCGTPLNQGNKFCTKCGNKID